MKTIKLTVLILFWSIAVFSQKKAQKVDSNSIYKEFTQLQHWYRQLPLQVKLQLVSRINVAAAGKDSIVTNMTLFYGKSEFYMEAEGLEQIANDSMIVLVNNETKMIKLFPNNKQFKANLEKTVMMLTADSSFNSLVKKYAASSVRITENVRQIVLRSRENVFGTDVPRELVTVSYNEQTHQPITFDQAKASLIPIDSIAYINLSKEEKYVGKLVNTNVNGINLFFILKQQQTYCRFENINRDVYRSPVKQENRIVRLENGEYRPVKELESYELSKEF